MGIHAIIGGQWGDEGKGKIVDYYSANADVVARFQGGANAGHTVAIGDDQFVLHQIPSGILHRGTRCLLGTGMVIDPVALFEEIRELRDRGIDECLDQIGLAYNAHLVLPGHKALDGISEEADQEQTIGTTRRGIGPAYADRHSRRGVPVSAMLDRSGFQSALEYHFQHTNRIITSIYSQDALNPADYTEQLEEARELLSSLITDVSDELHTALHAEQYIMAEGAQGVLLDLDFGSYPYVTSSHPGTIGIPTGLGVPPSAVTRSTGIFKAYCTRVGEGPFPTEITEPELQERLRQVGSEFGATTGRPRRCGWFDGPLGHYSARLNGFTDICITKADVLQSFDSIRLAESYRESTSFLNTHRLNTETPEYTAYPGWNEDISAIDSFADLPEELHSYLSALESLLNSPIRMISTGPERSQILFRDSEE